MEIYQYTGWKMSEVTARIIAYVCIGVMALGVTLILISFKKTKGKYEDSLAVTSEMMRVYQSNVAELDRVAAIEINGERLEKREIPKLLAEIDGYFVQAVEQQELDAETFVEICNKMFKWQDGLKLIYLMVTNSNRFLRRLFRDSHIKHIIRFSSKLNLILKEYVLGTLPVIESNSDYLNTYQRLIRLESGLPVYIITKIHRNVLLSASINSLRVMNPGKSFWDNIEPKSTNQYMQLALASILTKGKNIWSVFMIILDGVVTGLRSEIENDIQKYVESR